MDENKLVLLQFWYILGSGFVDSLRNLVFPAPAAGFCRVRRALKFGHMLCWRCVNFLEKGSPSQALPRQLSQRESQGLRLVAKVLGITRKLPAVPAPPRGSCRAATEGLLMEKRKKR